MLLLWFPCVIIKKIKKKKRFGQMLLGWADNDPHFKLECCRRVAKLDLEAAGSWVSAPSAPLFSLALGYLRAVNSQPLVHSHAVQPS